MGRNEINFGRSFVWNPIPEQLSKSGTLKKFHKIPQKPQLKQLSTTVIELDK